MRTSRTLVIAIAAVLARLTFGEAESYWKLDVPLLCCFAAITSLSEALAALNWIHWGHRRDWRAAIQAGPVLAISATLAGFALTSVLKPTYFSSAFKLYLLAGCSAWIVLLYYLTHRLHGRWRNSDLEYARRLQSTYRSTDLITRAIRRRLSQTVAAQLARDLQLTLRAFSSAVYVVFAAAAIWTVALAATLITDFLPTPSLNFGWLDATWLPQVVAVKITCVLAVATLASLLPVLIAYELPHMWLERAAGTTGLDIWSAKLWYARLVTIPGPIIVWFVGSITGKVPAFYVLPLLAECVWLWWLVSSVMGALSFEIPTRPELAIIVTATLGLAIGLLAAMLWPVGLIAYPQAMHSLTDRGRQRTRYYLITEDE